jgi:NDP-sugar pyrophosphorylase family protein
LWLFIKALLQLQSPLKATLHFPRKKKEMESFLIKKIDIKEKIWQTKKMVAMLLAGGKGTRLKSLTTKLAKPAVFFGGKYRIIDFPLSNCANSGIDTVGVLTQYESVALNTYISNGSNWGIDGNKSVTTNLPPRQTENGASWYKGTADAIYQNLDFLDHTDCEYVIILSGDHIYKMDYLKMLEFHKEKNADLTIAVLDVSLEDAKRFGIMKANQDGKVESFTEKPKHPESTLASMGIYIFNYKVMKSELIKDAKDPNSENDFGKNIIVTCLMKRKNFSLIDLMAIGKMLEPFSHYGKLIWIFWMENRLSTFMTKSRKFSLRIHAQLRSLLEKRLILLIQLSTKVQLFLVRSAIQLSSTR